MSYHHLYLVWFVTINWSSNTLPSLHTLSVADMESNSFRCNVVIYRQTSEAEEENHPIANYPCSPAFFGKASMTQIKQSEHGVVVKAILKPPLPGDEIGCKLSPSSLETCPVDDDDGHVQIVQRGNCSFTNKASNHRQAEGIIVINSHPYELFVMSGEKILGTNDPSNDEDELPVSVLVSGEDGGSILKLLKDEQSKGNEVIANIELVREEADTLIDFPHVKGTKESLQVLASNGWGVHAVPQSDEQQQQTPTWQLFITQHDKL